MNERLEFGSGAGFISIGEIVIGLLIVAALAILLWLVFRRRRP
jgi:hypothetical protein